MEKTTRRKDVGLAAMAVIISQVISGFQSTKSVGAEIAVLSAKIEIMNDQIRRLDERISLMQSTALGDIDHANREILLVEERGRFPGRPSLHKFGI